MVAVPRSPEYTPSTRHAVVDDPRWISLCGSLRGRSMSELRVMDESAFSCVLSQALRNKGWPTHVTRRLVTDGGDCRRLDRGGIPDVERAVTALRVSFGSGLDGPAIGVHYQDLEASLSDRLDALEALAPF
ncbi:hypothetical protein LIER_40246 [Lithospermum erythrorhizon]|uniref:Uncharacterized protein n=1 Tax=Lithospermum erythrorhizon TaxID=34254 RepID=A0AAV3QRS8_LITER